MMTRPAPSRIDAHLHLWDPTDGHATWLENAPELLRRRYGPDDALPEMDAAGIGRAILVQAADTTGESHELLRIAAAHPDRFAGVVGWIDLAAPQTAADALDDLLGRGRLVGIRQLVHDDPRPGLYDSSAVRTTARILADQGLPLEIPDAFPRDLPAATRLAADLPSLTVVLDHLGKPPRGDRAALDRWRTGLAEFAALPNTVAKVSGLHRQGCPYEVDALREVVAIALDDFGPDRLMLGSDWPVGLLGASYPDTMATLDGVLRNCGIGPGSDEEAALRYATAARVYALT